MNSRVSSGLTACVAVASAGVIAITPVVSPPTPPRVVDASAALMADFTGMNQAELVAEFGKRVAEQFAQAPFIPAAALLDIAAGDKDRLYTVVRSIVDAPLYVADPLIYAAAMTLPESQGGDPDHPQQSAIWQDFRIGTLYAQRQEMHELVADALGVADPNIDRNAAWALADGLIESMGRVVKGAGLGVVGVAAIAQAAAANDKVALYEAICEYVDAPLWAADPAIEGLANALPKAFGGDTDNNPDNVPTGALMDFRNNQLWHARNDVRVAVADVVGVEVDENGDDPVDPDAPSADVQRIAPQAAAPESGSQNAPETRQQKPKLNVANLKPHLTNVGTSLDDGKPRAEKRRDRAKANLDRVVNKAKEAADNTSKKLGLKKKSDADD